MSSSPSLLPPLGPPLAPSFTPHLPPASDLLPGAVLSVTTSTASPSSQPFTCLLHAYDAAASLLVVELSYPFDSPLSYHDRVDTRTARELEAEAAVKGDGKKDFALLNAHQIRVEVTTPAPSHPRVLPALSMDAIQAKLEENSQARAEEIQSIGIGVPPEAQKLFDAIRKTTPCKWSPDYASFVVMDTVRVSAPFTSASCSSIAPSAGGAGKKASAAAQAAAAEVMLNRVRKIVDAELRKL